MKLILLMFPVFILFTACGIGVGFAQTHGGTNLNYQVPVHDMQFEKEVSAKVKGPSVFCIFPVYDALMKQAMEKLNKEADIKNNSKAIFNLRVDVEDMFYVFWCTRHVTVSGDVYSIVREKPIAKPTIEEEQVISIDEPKKEDTKPSRFADPEERKKFLDPFWKALENKETAKIKDKVFSTLTDKPSLLKQEGFYFLADATLLEGNIEQAEYYYKRGVIEISSNPDKPDYSGLKFHLQQVSILFPDKKDVIQNIYTSLTK